MSSVRSNDASGFLPPPPPPPHHHHHLRYHHVCVRVREHTLLCVVDTRACARWSSEYNMISAQLKLLPVQRTLIRPLIPAAAPAALDISFSEFRSMKLFRFFAKTSSEKTAAAGVSAAASPAIFMSDLDLPPRVWYFRFSALSIVAFFCSKIEWGQQTQMDCWVLPSACKTCSHRSGKWKIFLLGNYFQWRKVQKCSNHLIPWRP